MKILLLSDTHGNLDKVYKIYDKLSNIDLIIHCGDNAKDGIILQDTLGLPVYYVKGNCDNSTSEDYKIVDTPYGKILVTHGDWQNVSVSYNKLVYLAMENHCIAACFGHTHIPLIEDCNEIKLINPGSLTFPRDGSNGSCVVINSNEEDFFASIVYYDTICNTSTKKRKVQGGFLRGLINYSDRF